MTRTSSKGMTLAEILVATFLFALVTSLVTHTLLSARRKQVKMDQMLLGQRLSAEALLTLQRELETVRSMVNPAPTTGFSDWTPSRANPWSLSRNIEGGSVQVDYWFDPTNGTLIRKEGTKQKVLASQITGFQITWDPTVDPLLFRAKVTPKGMTSGMTRKLRALVL